MKEKPKKTVSVVSEVKPFEPAEQSFEIWNHSNKKATILLEQLGSRCFKLSAQKLSLGAHALARVGVEFRVPKDGFIFTFNARYSATIKVWLLDEANSKANTLIDVINFTARGPGYLPPDILVGLEPKTSDQTKRG